MTDIVVSVIAALIAILRTEGWRITLEQIRSLFIDEEETVQVRCDIIAATMKNLDPKQVRASWSSLWVLKSIDELELKDTVLGELMSRCGLSGLWCLHMPKGMWKLHKDYQPKKRYRKAAIGIMEQEVIHGLFQLASLLNPGAHWVKHNRFIRDRVFPCVRVEDGMPMPSNPTRWEHLVSSIDRIRGGILHENPILVDVKLTMDIRKKWIKAMDHTTAKFRKAVKRAKMASEVLDAFADGQSHTEGEARQIRAVIVRNGDMSIVKGTQCYSAMQAALIDAADIQWEEGMIFSHIAKTRCDGDDKPEAGHSFMSLLRNAKDHAKGEVDGTLNLNMVQWFSEETQRLWIETSGWGGFIHEVGEVLRSDEIRAYKVKALAELIIRYQGRDVNDSMSGTIAWCLFPFLHATTPMWRMEAGLWRELTKALTTWKVGGGYFQLAADEAVEPGTALLPESVFDEYDDEFIVSRSPQTDGMSILIVKKAGVSSSNELVVNPADLEAMNADVDGDGVIAHMHTDERVLAGIKAEQQSYRQQLAANPLPEAPKKKKEFPIERNWELTAYEIDNYEIANITLAVNDAVRIVSDYGHDPRKVKVSLKGVTMTLWSLGSLIETVIQRKKWEHGDGKSIYNCTVADVEASINRMFINEGIPLTMDRAKEHRTSTHNVLSKMTRAIKRYVDKIEGAWNIATHHFWFTNNGWGLKAHTKSHLGMRRVNSKSEYLTKDGKPIRNTQAARSFYTDSIKKAENASKYAADYCPLIAWNRLTAGRKHAHGPLAIIMSHLGEVPQVEDWRGRMDSRKEWVCDAKGHAHLVKWMRTLLDGIREVVDEDLFWEIWNYVIVNDQQWFLTVADKDATAQEKRELKRSFRELEKKPFKIGRDTVIVGDGETEMINRTVLFELMTMYYCMVGGPNPGKDVTCWEDLASDPVMYRYERLRSITVNTLRVFEAAAKAQHDGETMYIDIVGLFKPAVAAWNTEDGDMDYLDYYDSLIDA